MELNLFLTVIGTGVAIIVAIIVALYTIIRNFKNEVNEKFECLEDRIFQLAMGKSLKDVLIEERTKKKAKGE